jgi:hypothetical protein
MAKLTPEALEMVRALRSGEASSLLPYEIADVLDALLAQREAVRSKLAEELRKSIDGSLVRTALYYGRPLEVRVADAQLVIAIGVQTLAHAVTCSDWANPYDEQANDYLRRFAIVDAEAFAKDVARAMLDEKEDGSTPLSDFLDKVSAAAVDDGSEATDEAVIRHGETAPSETWALVPPPPEPT